MTEEFRVLRNNLGEPNYVIRDYDVFYLPFDPVTRTFDESHPVVVELRQWEAENGDLDLSDILPDIDINVARATAISTLTDFAALKAEEAIKVYFPTERYSWESKVEEAQIFLANNNLTIAPRLKKELEAKGEQLSLFTAQALASSIINKAEIFSLVTAAITGIYERKRAELVAATSLRPILAYPIYEGWD